MNRNGNKTVSSMTNKTTNHCKICGQTVKGNSFSFKSHLYQHSVIKPRFECQYCPKKYFRSDVYRRHMNSHTRNGNQAKFVCDYCDRSFVDKRNLIYHLKVHDDSFNGRPDIQFKCQACGIFYCENRLLINHIRKEHYNLKVKEELHLKKTRNETWVEPVKDSKECVQMTKINNNVITIKRCVKQEYPINNIKTQDYISIHKSDQYCQVVCDYCNKSMLKKSLRSHIREKHLNIRKFGCDECKRTFKRHYQLVDHVCAKPRRVRRSNASKEAVGKSMKRIVKIETKVKRSPSTLVL